MPKSDQLRSKPISAKNWPPELAELGPKSPPRWARSTNIGQIWPGIDQCWEDFDRLWDVRANSARFGLDSAKSGLSSSESGTARDQLRPKFVRNRPNWPDFGQYRPNLARSQPRLVRNSPNKPGPSRPPTRIGPESTNLGARVRPNPARHCQTSTNISRGTTKLARIRSNLALRPNLDHRGRRTIIILELLSSNIVARSNAYAGCVRGGKLNGLFARCRSMVVARGRPELR